MLDLPKLHNPHDEISQKMAQALSDVEETDIFRYKSIQSIIAFRWGPCKQYVLRR